MALGLLLCILINIMMGFSTSFYLFVGLVILLGVFQGMGLVLQLLPLGIGIHVVSVGEQVQLGMYHII